MKDSPDSRYDTEFGNYTVISERKAVFNDICYFAGHTLFDEYPDYVYFFLQQLNDVNFDIVFISSSPLTERSIARLEKYCIVIIQKENKGTDFGAWRVALAYTNFASGHNAIILANDSVFGPFRSLKTDLKNLAPGYDLWGYSASLEIDYHIQSYFLYCSKKLINSDFWRNFWREMVFISNKEELVKNYEIGLSQQALKHGFRIGAYVDARNLKKQLNIHSDQINYTISAWKELISNYHYPFLKRELLIKEIGNANNAGWKSLITDVFPEFTIGLIEDFLKSFLKSHAEKNKFSHILRNKEIILLTYFRDKINDHQLLALNIASQMRDLTGEGVICYQLTNGKLSSQLDALDPDSGIAYAGIINIDLVQQYIYHWNKYNIRALLIDRQTFNMFYPLFSNFYSGNILVIGKDENNNAILEHYIRTELKDSISTALPDALIKELYSSEIALKADKEFFNTYNYFALNHCITSHKWSLVYQKPPVESIGPAVESKLAVSAVLPTEMTIEYKHRHFFLLYNDQVLHQTEDLDIFCSRLSAEIENRTEDAKKIAAAVGLPLFNINIFFPILRICIMQNEMNMSISPQTASFTHIYYKDSLFEILPYLYNLSYLNNHRYFFSISEETINKHEIATVLKHFFPGCLIQIVRNTGKDIGGKLILLKLYFELGLHADYFLFLHDKKSIHSYAIEGNAWRNDLFKIVEPGFVSSIFSLFEANGKIGLIGNKKWLNNTDFDYNENKFAFHDAFFKKKMQEYDIKIADYRFLGGTMFWIRETIMRSFFEKYSLFEILEKLENGNILDSREGTETHFLERLFGWFTTFENYELSGV